MVYCWVVLLIEVLWNATLEDLKMRVETPHNTKRQRVFDFCTVHARVQVRVSIVIQPTVLIAYGRGMMSSSSGSFAWFTFSLVNLHFCFLKTFILTKTNFRFFWKKQNWNQLLKPSEEGLK
jgi:hypothetical protein